MEKTNHFNGRVYETRRTVAPGTALTLLFATAGHASLSVHPKLGATAHVQFSTSPRESLGTEHEEFQPAKGIGTLGVVSGASDYVDITHPLTALRVIAFDGPVVVEMLQQ